MPTTTPQPQATLRLAAEQGAALASGSLALYAQTAEGAIVGCIDLYAYDPLNRRCAVGIMVGKEHRRKGYALAMLAELRRMASTALGLHLLYADIAAPNRASQALFRKAGYEPCGTFRQWLKVGEGYADCVRMQLIVQE